MDITRWQHARWARGLALLGPLAAAAGATRVGTQHSDGVDHLALLLKLHGGDEAKIRRLAEVAGLPVQEVAAEMLRVMGGADVTISDIRPETGDITVTRRAYEGPIPRVTPYTPKPSGACRRLARQLDQEPRPAEHRATQKTRRKAKSKTKRKRGW